MEARLCSIGRKKNGGASELGRSAEKERGIVGALDIVVLDSVGV